MSTIIYIAITSAIIYYLCVVMPKQLAGKEKDLIKHDTNTYEDQLLLLAKAAQGINDHKECAAVINAIDCFSQKYKATYNQCLVEIDVTMLCGLVEKRYNKISKSQMQMSTGLWL